MAQLPKNNAPQECTPAVGGPRATYRKSKNPASEAFRCPILFYYVSEDLLSPCGATASLYVCTYAILDFSRPAWLTLQYSSSTMVVDPIFLWLAY